MSDWSTRDQIKMFGIFMFFKYWRYWIIIIPIGFIALGYFWGAE